MQALMRRIEAEVFEISVLFKNRSHFIYHQLPPIFFGDRLPDNHLVTAGLLG